MNHGKITTFSVCTVKGSQIFMGTHPSSLGAVGYHYDAFHFLFPDHPPEIIHCGPQRTLSGDVLSVAVVALRSNCQS